jgi:ABC-type antimicrobial peptide transport system permease subunit
MGVRIALGAQRRDIVDLVLGDGLRVVVIGIAIGVIVALLLGRLVAALLFGVLPNDVSVLIIAAVSLCGIAAVACVVPALRAGSVDPVSTLRAD